MQALAVLVVVTRAKAMAFLEYLRVWSDVWHTTSQRAFHLLPVAYRALQLLGRSL